MDRKEKILIVEDEFIVGNDLKMILIKGGYEICGIAPSVEQARILIQQKKPDWVLLDIILKTPTSGIELAKELLQQRIPFLYISANTNQQTLEAAKATQPYGFLVKPFREKDLFVMLDIARYRHGVETGMIKDTLPVPTAETTFDPNIIGCSQAMKQALDKANIVATTNTSVLLLGESGTGKERFARAIHKNSLRKHKPFVTVNCAALPFSLLESALFGHERGAFTDAIQQHTGKFEQANGGTLFLDEIGELPPEAQVKLLRTLQEKEVEKLGSGQVIKVDVRLIAATNRNLEKEVAEGRFRLDLYYRLNVFPITLPPLREHKEDIHALAIHFLKRFADNAGSEIAGISEAALQTLQQHDWPGNIRELEHVIERQYILAGGAMIHAIDIPELPAPLIHAEGKLETMEEMERLHIMKVLKACNGRVSGQQGAADILRIPAQTLYSKMKKLGIKTIYK
ncbi:sigma-54-dependent transcriptional regulator [Chitinophaga qingshengii]|uniref:Sigma-54-dependent Fis family transcriptional regulator n=1 Tax=Chitinophaga qingshengii TaxID=1569794 RepID=A0ABR7TS18_9BACT|nr:sigma-54 dependent transcriptional regulator [Chitinophaga qingshengii]MBC9932261.1 sigma-54-dependent Fis family transcriptional regulator [Chitinophaga qingshengii]